ncbi:hypothetical protein F0562_023244 [Nyssa sinensis]|uniref:HVA22-like protein n=1 Tax=Nyssa sinensis TaxID=561372 RepID=A0A5J5BK63_9ASTE|nr:hypothetical protein F0562_023244 [Nyssa sinensis]
MGRFLTLLTHVHSLAGPVVMLLYPLYASVIAMETTSKVDDEQWLAYWILYSFLSLVEMLLQPILEWIPIWYDLKLAFVVWLVLPRFRGAAFIYQRFVREKIKKYGVIDRHYKSSNDKGKNKSVDFITPKKGEQEVKTSPARSSSLPVPPLASVSILHYEYARRGACLSLGARRENRLREVAERARELGCPNVITIRTDVSKVEDCKRLVDVTIDHFGRLDHLVNNAGINSICMFEEVEDVTNLRTIMDINFWGSVYMIRFVVPHLRNSGGRIIAVSSSASWLPAPRISFYNASKVAMSSFFETLRVELDPTSK